MTDPVALAVSRAVDDNRLSEKEITDMNEVAKTANNLPANIGSLATSLANSAGQAGAAPTSDLYLKMTKIGEWVFGVEDDELEEGAVLAVNPMGFQHGFTAWGTEEHGNLGTNVGEVMVGANQPLPSEVDLPDVKGRWTKQIGVQFRVTNGEDEGLQLLWKANSLGARKAYAQLVNAVVARIQEGKSDIVPLVELGTDSYKHKTYGKIFTPEITIVGWTTMDGATPEPAEDKPQQKELDLDDKADAEEAPKRRRRRRAA